MGYKFLPNGNESRSVRKLNRLRNTFIHFMPQGWSLELSGMPDICLDCLSIVARLDEDSLCMRWDTSDERHTFQTVLAESEGKLKAVRLIYRS